MKNGYSLIELSICLALLGIIMGSGLAIGNMGNVRAQAEITEAQLDEIEYAIQMFVNRTKRLPCPASLTAAEDTASFGIEGVCANAAPVAGVTEVNDVAAEEIWIGALPTRTLGLSDAKMFDPWNSRITYALPKYYATNVANQIKTANGSVLTNLISVLDKNNNPTFQQPTTPTPFTNQIVYVLLSHGADKRGAYNNAGALRAACGAGGQLDVENCDNLNAIFRQMELRTSKVATQYFHDFLRFKTRVQLGAAALN